MSDSYNNNIELVSRLNELLENKMYEQAQMLVNNMSIETIEQFLNTSNSENRTNFIHYINFDTLVLSELPDVILYEIHDAVGTQRFVELLSELDIRHILMAIEGLSNKIQQNIIKCLPIVTQSLVSKLLTYPEDSAGRILHRNLITVPHNLTVEETICHLSETGTSNKFHKKLHQIFLLDSQNKILGSVLLNNLVCAPKHLPILDIAKKDVILIETDTPREEIADIFEEHDLQTAPVVNTLGQAVGFITIDDIVDIIEEETEKELLHIGGISHGEITTTLFNTIYYRSPWLFITVIAASINSFAISSFEHVIEAVVALAALMPVTAALTGNTGSQAVTIAVRAISTKQLTILNSFRYLKREVLIGLILGCVFSFLIGSITLLRFQDPYLVLVFMLAMMGTSVASTVCGAGIPLLFRHYGFDPAVASGVMVTAITDICSFTLSLYLADLILL